jgi:hypothetical protein
MMKKRGISDKFCLFSLIIILCGITFTFSQDSLHYTRLRIVNSNNDTSLSVITMNTNQETTLIVQGKRSDNREWEFVVAKWEVLDSMLMGTLVPFPPDAACMWSFSGLTYASGRLRVTFSNDSITEPDTIRIEIQPGCGPIGGKFTFLTPLSHVETGDTNTAIVWIGTPGALNGWPYCIVPYWCFPDSSNVNIFYFDTLAPDSSQASFVITGEGIARVGQYNSTHFPVKECFTNQIDTVKFVFNYAGMHKLFIGFSSINQ